MAAVPLGKELERSGDLALHEQLSDRLREFAKAAGHGSRLPSEQHLIERYGVSRVTVRRAMETLVEEGVVVRHQGRGTFVGPQRVQSLDRLRPFVDAFEENSDVEARLLDFGWTSSATLPAGCGGPNGRALTFRRLYVSDGAPHALIRVSVPEALGRRITREALKSRPIYHVLQNDLEIGLRDARLDVTSELAGFDVADLLQIPAGSHLLVLGRVTVDVHGEVVEASTHYLRPEAYRLRLTVGGGALPEVIRLPGKTDESGDT